MHERTCWFSCYGRSIYVCTRVTDLDRTSGEGACSVVVAALLPLEPPSVAQQTASEPDSLDLRARARYSERLYASEVGRRFRFDVRDGIRGLNCTNSTVFRHVAILTKAAVLLARWSGGC